MNRYDSKTFTARQFENTEDFNSFINGIKRDLPAYRFMVEEFLSNATGIPCVTIHWKFGDMEVSRALDAYTATYFG